MLYRQMSKSEDKLSILGFGCMRLPLISRDPEIIDEKEATRMIRHAIDSGVNYIDTAWPYHNEESEPLVGRALLDGYRDRVFLATKLPTWAINSREDMDFYLNEQLKKLKTDHIDYYLIHALTRDRWARVLEHDLFDFIEKAKIDGRIRYIGFSFHDEVSLFREIVDACSWDFCQIQYNYMDEDYQAGTAGLQYASEKGLGVIVMEPL
ncbi:MAG TPA: aldo/keto reductase, partial [Synergistales bacterium]|nr:aldo/keto reductase [Synergistales bacterium]